jgi:hypothetical protein
MDDGQIPSLTGGQIVAEMGIPGEEHLALAIGTDFLGDFAVQFFSAGETQSAVYEVVLIVDDE